MANMTEDQLQRLLGAITGAAAAPTRVEFSDKRIRAKPFDGLYPGTIGFYLDGIKRIADDQNIAENRTIAEVHNLLDPTSTKALQTLSPDDLADWATFRTALVDAVNPKALIGPKRTYLRSAKMAGQSKDTHTQEELNQWKEKVFGLTAATLPGGTRESVEEKAAEYFVQGLPPQIAYLVRCGLDEDESWTKCISVAEKVMHSHNQAVESNKSSETEQVLSIKTSDQAIGKSTIEKDVHELKGKFEEMTVAMQKLATGQKQDKAYAVGGQSWDRQNSSRNQDWNYQGGQEREQYRNQGSQEREQYRNQGSQDREQYRNQDWNRSRRGYNSSPNRRQGSPYRRYDSPMRGHFSPARNQSPGRSTSPYRSNYQGQRQNYVPNYPPQAGPYPSYGYQQPTGPMYPYMMPNPSGVPPQQYQPAPDQYFQPGPERNRSPRS